MATYETLSDFQRTARKRLADAYELLEPPTRDTKLTTEHQDGAVYLAGYAVECALKAFLMRQLEARNISVRNLEDVALALGYWRQQAWFRTHKLEILRDGGGLYAQIMGDPELTKDFSECLKWCPEWRYKGTRVTANEAEAREFVDAVGRMYHWVEGLMP